MTYSITDKLCILTNRELLVTMNTYYVKEVFILKGKKPKQTRGASCLI